MTSTTMCRPGWARVGFATLLAMLLVPACAELPREVQGLDLPGTRAKDASQDEARVPQVPSHFAIEEAMGAECDKKWVSEPPLQDSACYGMLPEHVASFIRAIPDGHPYLSALQREKSAQKKQRFRAIEGYGHRPDILAVIEHYGTFWIRSLEGLDPEVTNYVVYGPSCNDDPYVRQSFVGDGCLPGAPYVVRELKIYRVRSDGEPEDVTRELAPEPPRLTQAERERYGIYLRPEEEGSAVDTDIGLDVTRLARVPVMRWVLRPVQEGEHEAPAMPASDPRAFQDYDWRDNAAHFGFLAWTGERFELRESVSPDLWPCLSVESARHVCGAGSDNIVDRYVTPSAGDKVGRPRP